MFDLRCAICPNNHSKGKSEIVTTGLGNMVMYTASHDCFSKCTCPIPVLLLWCLWQAGHPVRFHCSQESLVLTLVLEGCCMWGLNVDGWGYALWVWLVLKTQRRFQSYLHFLPHHLPGQNHTELEWRAWGQWWEKQTRDKDDWCWPPWAAISCGSSSAVWGKTPPPRLSWWSGWKICPGLVSRHTWGSHLQKG